MSLDKHNNCFMQEDLINLKLDTQESKQDIKYIKTELDKTAKINRHEHEELKKTLKKYLDKIDNDCAGKWVENAMYAVAFMVLTAIVGALLKLIII
jgi:hypothetical protein